MASGLSMGFSDAQRVQFFALLESKGWTMQDGMIVAPSDGLWFSDAHVDDWTPADMQEIFTRRAARIGAIKIGEWQISSDENRQAAWAAEEVSSTWSEQATS